jgi:tricorn protease
VEGKEWIVEVNTDPLREFAGIDDHLNKAIEVIKEEMKKNPVSLPPPPYPDKSK